MRNEKHLPLFRIPDILRWADAHRHRHGTWPTCPIGPHPGGPGRRLAPVNTAINRGQRGLRRLLAGAPARRPAWGTQRHRPPPADRGADPGLGRRHRAGPADGPRSGRVRSRRRTGETWQGVQNALYIGLRGLPGGSSIARLLARASDGPTAASARGPGRADARRIRWRTLRRSGPAIGPPDGAMRPRLSARVHRRPARRPYGTRRKRSSRGTSRRSTGPSGRRAGRLDPHRAGEPDRRQASRAPVPLSPVPSRGRATALVTRSAVAIGHASFVIAARAPERARATSASRPVRPSAPSSRDSLGGTVYIIARDAGRSDLESQPERLETATRPTAVFPGRHLHRLQQRLGSPGRWQPTISRSTDFGQDRLPRPVLRSVSPARRGSGRAGMVTSPRRPRRPPSGTRGRIPPRA